ncbi:ComEC/Rec2 family competence protein [Malacoplasma iowae]|uniref:ComEC/Rec2 family competence protein n=1 Tax=Malacoplasma iowae 695 TaxID=1048830 RepID=A0A6P1LC97_MALIO|nr:ComEC/Rec2 family competence protein [Malacoplasma iowae]QHG90026.1 ComEC/Rec2 family competence protein [Malacoplasma iowae 695]WPL36245.1 ComEC/Rec2 family competence protein [Malacoplasma iowae]VEU61977.1 Uncharacterised protein [Mycoplasmopsis fermentans]VEU70710.1 Uncharacterised protein [Malacoplasma iowae]
MNKYFDLKYFALALIVFAIGFYNHEQFILLLLTYFGYHIIKGNNRFLVLVNFYLAMLVSLSILEINKNSKILIGEWLNNLVGFSIRDYLINFNTNNYGEELGSFLNLILFGYKNSVVNELYKKIVNLSLLHLFIISGIHISFLALVIKKIFVKKWLYFPISFFLLFFICYVNNFNIGSFRALIFFILSGFKFKNKNPKLWISIIVIFLLAPKSLSQFSFQMTYISLFVLFMNFKWNKKLLLNSIIISILINIYLLPYISNMNKKISLLGFFYSYIFSPLVLANYFIALFTFMIPSYDVLNFFYQVFKEMVLLSENINVVITLPIIPVNYFPLYLIFIWSLNLLFYKVNDNKIWRK